jgi:hypothetical protein
MGRYARFSTTFEYKFVFGIQPSSDITIFGGKDDDNDDEENYENCDEDYMHFRSIYSYHEWSRNDKEYVMGELSKYEGFITPNFETYTMDTDGTYEIYKDIFDLNNEVNDKEMLYKFCLGCLIYHQLLYCAELNCYYEY